MKHSFRGRRFSVRFRQFNPAERKTKTVGWCDTSGREIEIDKALRGKELLATLLHESGHACLPDATEEAIRDTCNDQADFLWKMGYRREETRC